MDKLADFFEVSRISAKIRLVEVGLESHLIEMTDYADVFGEFKRREHIAISAADAFTLLSENAVFEEWVKICSWASVLGVNLTCEWHREFWKSRISF